MLLRWIFWWKSFRCDCCPLITRYTGFLSWERNRYDDVNQLIQAHDATVAVNSQTTCTQFITCKLWQDFWSLVQWRFSPANLKFFNFCSLLIILVCSWSGAGEYTWLFFLRELDFQDIGLMNNAAQPHVPAAAAICLAWPSTWIDHDHYRSKVSTRWSTYEWLILREPKYRSEHRSKTERPFEQSPLPPPAVSHAYVFNFITTPLYPIR